MSKKPVNFYQGAKGTFRIDLIGNDDALKVTHTYKEIMQAIKDGFIPYFIRETDRVYYYFLNSYSDATLIFSGETEDIIIDNYNTITIYEKESGGSGGSDGGAFEIVGIAGMDITYSAQDIAPGNNNIQCTMRDDYSVGVWPPTYDDFYTSNIYGTDFTSFPGCIVNECVINPPIGENTGSCVINVYNPDSVFGASGGAIANVTFLVIRANEA